MYDEKLRNMPSQPGNQKQNKNAYPQSDAVNPANVSIAKPATDDMNAAMQGDIAPILGLMERILLHYPMLLRGGMANDMLKLRANYPFLPISPYSILNAIVNSDGVNAIDIIIPKNAVLVRFSANASFVANFGGIANAPAAPTTTQVDATIQNCGMLNPTDDWKYIPNANTVSVISVGGTGLIGASFIIPRS